MRTRKSRTVDPAGAVTTLTRPASALAPAQLPAPRTGSAPPVAPSSRPTSPYFINGPVDFCLIGGVSILTYLVMRSMSDGARTGSIITLAAQLSWLVNWPHFSATNYRLYHSTENIKQYPITALLIPWLLVAAMIGSILSPLGVAPYFVKLFFWWSPYHFCGQTFGVTMLYARRCGFPIGKWERHSLSTFIFGSFLTLTSESEVLRPGAAPLDYYGIRYLPIGLPSWIPTACLIVTWIGGGVFLLLIGLSALRTRRLPPFIFFVPAAAQYLWFVLGKDMLSFVEFVPFFHSLQYLLIAWAMQLKEKMDQKQIAPSHGYVWTESLRWSLINIGGGALLFYVMPRLVSQAASVPLDFAIGVTIVAVQIHHFFVDGVIWKLKRKTVGSPLMVNLGDLVARPRLA